MKLNQLKVAWAQMFWTSEKFSSDIQLFRVVSYSNLLAASNITHACTYNCKSKWAITFETGVTRVLHMVGINCMLVLVSGFIRNLLLLVLHVSYGVQLNLLAYYQ